jgi:hypothetical protein
MAKKLVLKKLPKRPKQSATAETWAKYDSRLADTIKDNNARKAKFESDKKKKANLIKSTSEKVMKYRK